MPLRVIFNLIETFNFFLKFFRNHAWVSFQGFGESFNDAFIVPKEFGKNKEQLLCHMSICVISPHIVSEAFYRGELEAEQRRIGRID